MSKIVSKTNFTHFTCAKSTVTGQIMKRKSSSSSKSPKKQKMERAPPSPQIIKRGKKIAEKLQELYPEPEIPLHHGSNFQLLVAVALSAQTTDKKVNEVSPKLFEVAPTAEKMASLTAGEIQKIIQQIGLAPTKSKNVLKMSQQLVEEYNGEVPDSLEELEKLAGVGHKTASVVMCQAFNKPAFPVDTHIHRLAQRWGLTQPKSSIKQTEEDLKLVFPENIWCTVHLQIIYAGREYCPAKKHKVEECPLCTLVANEQDESEHEQNGITGDQNAGTGEQNESGNDQDGSEQEHNLSQEDDQKN